MLDDSEVQQGVLAELAWDPRINATHIGVKANYGVVTLTGHVESFAEKCAAEEAARRVNGVKALAEELEMRLPYDRKRGDDQIAAAAIESLASDVSVHDGMIIVNVDNGWITLTGQVDWHFQREAAEQDVRRLSGVVGVSNETTIRSVVDTWDISEKITQALHRSSFYDPKAVKVTADGGKVLLTGSVRSLDDRKLAEATAWAAAGVTTVEDSLEII